MGLRFAAADEPVRFSPASLVDAARRIREPCVIVESDDGGRGVGFGGTLTTTGHAGAPVLGSLPPLFPEHLGDRSFNEVHGCRFPYVVGEMANGIATAKMVIAAHKAGLLGFFGAAGLSPARIDGELDTIIAGIGNAARPDSWGTNLIHSPHEPDLEMGVVELYLRRGVTRVSASAYMDLTPMVVRYAASGLRLVDGRIVRKNRVFAKISRPETAAHFLKPMPQSLLEPLVRAGHITADEALLAARVPAATDITVEADSGGHTDNQALPCVFPAVKQLALQLSRKHEVQAITGEPVRVGAAGGLGTPDAVAAAFSMGAAYVLTGSVNQCAVESGLSPRGRALLAGVRLGDVTMCPAADMFEMGVKVQVLKKGSMFANRAHKLYELYRQCASLDAIPAAEKAKLEADVLRQSVDDAWAATRSFFEKRDPREIVKADASPKHKMALVFRSYLGQASKWAIAGDEGRALDFQIWCGPAMGSFNAWVEGTFLEPVENRTVAQIGWNLMEGAAVVTRAQQLRSAGVPLPDDAFLFRPRMLEV
ncbi:MAG: PfaD family polyunsaturated fatty acid/polyketide biosynthesis protein [Deltaproteobacteria bacterium]|nr:PfaD family polyunsaturated fatty acid/polyketide biosynthesis protein [Deltaproteobacteria bacterium]